MKKIYNIFTTSDFETKTASFECVFDSSKIRNKKINTITHIVNIKGDLEKSIFFEGGEKTILDDYCLLLSIFQGNYISYENNNFLPILKKVSDFELFLSDELGDFLDISISKLEELKTKENGLFEVIRRSLLLYYEAKFLLIYNENEILLMMHLFEYLLGSFYRINEQVEEDNIFLDTTFPYICKKLKYQSFIDTKLKINIKPKKLSTFKQEKNVKNINDFKEQFSKMRNWIQHGKHSKKPSFDSPSNVEFTFNYRLQSFIRLILSDLIYGKDYARKIDILYQLILEKNVCFSPTPDFNTKIFINKK